LAGVFNGGCEFLVGLQLSLGGGIRCEEGVDFGCLFG
jgi:hypothetical protein